MTISHSTFIRNRCGAGCSGGGLATGGGPVTISDSAFIGNAALDGPGGGLSAVAQ